MTLEHAYKSIKAIGFGEYEARAYCALLAQSPANGYQISVHSGVPRAKVYEVLDRLVFRGAAVRVETAVTGRPSAQVLAIASEIGEAYNCFEDVIPVTGAAAPS